MLLRLDGVACTRGGRSLFAGVDVALAAGDALLVTGANGAGKSSLIRIAAGLLRPDSGRVEAVPPALADGRAALDGEVTLARALGWWARADGGTAERAMAEWALAPLAEVPVRLLSTGQRQRANLARVAASGRRLWLLDEPANGLDAGSVRVLDRAIAAHRADGGAVVVASHIPIALPDAARVAL